ncbi:MAG: hypothetical protein QXI60_08185 [Thermofilaceae archaeon]
MMRLAWALAWVTGSVVLAFILAVAGAALAAPADQLLPTPTPTPTPTPVAPAPPELGGLSGGFYAAVVALGILSVIAGVGLLPMLTVLVLSVMGYSYSSFWGGLVVLFIAVGVRVLRGR